MVVGPSGTGRRGAEGVDAYVLGKTGTAEVGKGANRRKNTWFIAYATGTDASRAAARTDAVAVALVVENGESGGGTAAPKVCEILKVVFNPREEARDAS
jgi:cell division protein FtsI/penicillin-binding protein 2